MSRLRWWVGMIGIGLGLGMPMLVRAQTSDNGDKYLPAEELKSEEKARLQALKEGTKTPTENDAPLFEKAAKWYVNRITHKKYQERIPPDGVTLPNGQSVYDIIHKDLFPMIPIVDPQKNQQYTPAQLAYLQAMLPALIKQIDEVLLTPVPIARVNAALVLNRLSETGQEIVAAELLKILNNPNMIDAVKFYCLRGLKNIFRTRYLPRYEDPFHDKDLEEKCIEANLNFAIRKANLPKGTPADEVLAFQYLRREAIRALGYTRFPAIKKNKRIFNRTAFELCRFLAKEGFDLPPSPAEQLEAAIALCNLKSMESLDYLIEVPTYLIAKFVLEFADRYELDRNQGNRVSGSWKVDSARLRVALEHFKADTASKSGSKKVDDMVPVATAVLKSIESVQNVELKKLRDWVDANPPKDNLVYSNQPDSAIRISVTKDTN